MGISVIILSLLVAERVTVEDWNTPAEVRQTYEASCEGKTVSFEFRSRSKSAIKEKVSIKIDGTAVASPDLTSMNSIIHPASIENVEILSCNESSENGKVISGVFTLNQPANSYGRMTRFISFKIFGNELITDKK